MGHVKVWWMVEGWFNGLSSFLSLSVDFQKIILTANVHDTFTLCTSPMLTLRFETDYHAHFKENKYLQKCNRLTRVSEKNGRHKQVQSKDNIIITNVIL